MIDKTRVTAYENLGVSEQVEEMKHNLTEELQGEDLLVSLIEGAFEMGFALGTHTARWGY